MNESQARSGIIRYASATGPGAHYEVDEPLGYALLSILERAVRMGTARELYADAEPAPRAMCSGCNGAGVVYLDPLNIGDFQRATCAKCDGTGIA